VPEEDLTGRNFVPFKLYGAAISVCGPLFFRHLLNINIKIVDFRNVLVNAEI